MERYTGGCLCGDVRFVATGRPYRVGLCHCLDCRKLHGALFHASAIFHRDAVTIEGETGEYKGRRFCPRCGSTVFGRSDDEVEVNLGSFHMDEDLLLELNPEAEFAAGETIIVADAGANLETGKVARIEADKAMGAVRAYDSSGTLLAAYPATIGSSDTPSPSGEMKVTAIAPAPTYTYNPKVNFDAGPDEILILPAGPNGPVGGTWIDLEKDTYGIHGTADPAKVDKEFSHGCVRLTNWDAAELAGLVVDGETMVTFVDSPEG